VLCWPGGTTPRNPPSLGGSLSPQTPSAPRGPPARLRMIVLGIFPVTG